jgi:hypothetical protein
MQRKNRFEIFLVFSWIFQDLKTLLKKNKIKFPFSVYSTYQGSSQVPPKTSAAILSHPAGSGV